MNDRYDVVVIGARCAGAATAMLLARRGLTVLAIDRGGYGTDTRSTLALMRTGVAQLERWGLLEEVRASGTPAVRSATFHYGDELVAAQIKPRDGVDALYAPRRTVLDALLVDAARSAGAEVRHRTSLESLIRGDDGRICGVVVEDARGRHAVRARWVVGADGVGSSVARLVDAGWVRRARHASSLIYGFTPDLDLEGYHWFNSPSASAGAIPTNDSHHCVFAAAPPARFRTEVRRGSERAMRRILADAAPELADADYGRLRAFAGRPGYLREAWGPGWALVGDAGYFKDPLTSHGITDAFRDAELLSRALSRALDGGGDAALVRYQAARDEASIPLMQITDEIASYRWTLPQLVTLHRRLSAAMRLDDEALRERGPRAA